MKLLFAGTPAVALPSLQALARRFEVAGVLTAPDGRSGRGRKSAPTPVKLCALELGLKTLQPSKLDAEARESIADLGVDLMVVFAYGRIFGPRFLSLFSRGAVNLHPSALPKYRGPAPLAAVILAGESETALTVQRVDNEVDAGEILLQKPMPLTGRETTGSLTDRVSVEAAPLLVQAVEALETGELAGRSQDHEAASYCRNVSKEDGLIDWSLPAPRIERMVRAYDPWPGAYSSVFGKTLILRESRVSAMEGTGRPGLVVGVDTLSGILIQTGKGVLAVSRLQLAHRKPMDVPSFLNGTPIASGTILGDTW